MIFTFPGKITLQDLMTFLQNKIYKFDDGAQVLILSGIHGSSTGDFGSKFDEPLLDEFYDGIDFKLQELKKLRENVDFSCNMHMPSDPMEFMEYLETENFSALVFAFSYSNVSSVNDILRSSGIYADLII